MLDSLKDKRARETIEAFKYSTVVVRHSSVRPVLTSLGKNYRYWISGKAEERGLVLMSNQPLTAVLVANVGVLMVFLSISFFFQ